MKWYKIASKRINAYWWDAVLAPLNELETIATAGLVHLEAHSENSLSNLDKVKSLKKCSSSEGNVNVNVDKIAKSSLPGHGSLNEEFGLKESKQNCLNIDVRSSSKCGVTTRNSLEDMELQTRALTEPLPTNQQVCIK